MTANRGTKLSGSLEREQRAYEGTVSATGMLKQRVGQTLKGRYRIDRVLHCGVDSTVYAGMDLKSGHAAIKVFDRTSDVGLSTRSYLANAVGHPSTVNVLDSGSSDDGTLFVVMELLEATSMAQLMTQHAGRLPVRMACNIADQALDLLTSAHAQGIVHGELELGKLFYARGERLKVIGFGRLIGTAASDAPTPEQSAAYANDVRSLTRVIAQLLVGKPVDTLLVTEPSRATQPALPRRIAAVLQKGLTNDAAQHWQSARAMRTALQLACLAELGRPVDRELRGFAAKQKRARTGRGVWLAAAGALVGSMFVLRDFVEPSVSAPAAHNEPAEPSETRRQDQGDVQTDNSASLSQDGDGLPVEPANARAEAAPQAQHAQGSQPARVVPRKPAIPELRARLAESPALPALSNSVGPANQLCAQLTAARRLRALSEEEAQLWVARCGSP